MKGLTCKNSKLLSRLFYGLVFCVSLLALSVSPLVSKKVSATSVQLYSYQLYGYDTYAREDLGHLHWSNHFGTELEWYKASRLRFTSESYTRSGDYFTVDYGGLFSMFSSTGKFNVANMAKLGYGGCSFGGVTATLKDQDIQITEGQAGGLSNGMGVAFYVELQLPSSAPTSGRLVCDISTSDNSFFAESALPPSVWKIQELSEGLVINSYGSSSEIPDPTPPSPPSSDTIQIVGGLNNINNSMIDVKNSINDFKDQSHQDAQNTQNAINSAKNQAHQDSQAQLEESKKQTQAIEETKDFVTDPSTPDSSDIATSDSLPSVGLLPAGPLDSILTLPLNIANSILSSLGGNCTPITAPLPFVDKSITFPCVGDTIYQGDFKALEMLFGGVASAVILFYYFKHLYKKVDRAVSLETNDEDEWGIL